MHVPWVLHMRALPDVSPPALRTRRGGIFLAALWMRTGGRFLMPACPHCGSPLMFNHVDSIGQGAGK